MALVFAKRVPLRGVAEVQVHCSTAPRLAVGEGFDTLDLKDAKALLDELHV